MKNTVTASSRIRWFLRRIKARQRRISFPNIALTKLRREPKNERPLFSLDENPLTIRYPRAYLESIDNVAWQQNCTSWKDCEVVQLADVSVHCLLPWKCPLSLFFLAGWLMCLNQVTCRVQSPCVEYRIAICTEECNHWSLSGNAVCIQSCWTSEPPKEQKVWCSGGSFHVIWSHMILCSVTVERDLSHCEHENFGTVSVFLKPCIISGGQQWEAVQVTESIYETFSERQWRTGHSSLHTLQHRFQLPSPRGKMTLSVLGREREFADCLFVQLATASGELTEKEQKVLLCTCEQSNRNTAVCYSSQTAKSDHLFILFSVSVRSVQWSWRRRVGVLQDNGRHVPLTNCKFASVKNPTEM